MQQLFAEGAGEVTSRDFCYWLQGFFELTKETEISSSQMELVKKHLALVFKHEIDPSMGPPAHQDELNKIHKNSFEYLGSKTEDGSVIRC